MRRLQTHRRMLKYLPLLALLAMSASSCVARAAAAAPVNRDWVLLGQRSVTDRVDRDRIAVTAARGEFRRVKLTVSRASVDFRRVVIHYGNGQKDEINLRATVRAGGETRAIDLPGRDRVIRSIEFLYDANTVRGRQAVVRVFGLR